MGGCKRQASADTSRLDGAPFIALKDVPLLSYDDTEPARLTWTLAYGQQWALIGPTSAGKSLLARVIAGLRRLPGGEIRYHFLEDPSAGATPVDLAQVRRAIAYVVFDNRARRNTDFHQSRWHASLEAQSPTVDKYLSSDSLEQRNPYKVAPHRSDVSAGFPACRHRVVSHLALTHLLNRHLHHLSDGEGRRVEIARALLRRPSLLILDDPFTGLDGHFRRQLHTLIGGLMQQGMHLLFVASDPAELPGGITHVLAIEQNRVVAQGPRSQITHRFPPAKTGPATTAPKADPAEADCDAPTIVELRHVNVVHNGVEVLRNVDWTVRRGEKWALIGPNGAGKSTLLSLVLGDHPQAYANYVELFGRRRGSGDSIWEIKRRIGWVAPELHRYTPLTATVAEVVGSGFFDTLGLYRRPTDAQRSEAESWLRWLGLLSNTQRAFRRLSAGEQRLALVARALVKTPELLILDEPCQGLDPVHRARVIATLERLTEATPTAMIYVTHKPEEFPNTITHLLALHQGQVVRRVALSRALEPQV